MAKSPYYYLGNKASTTRKPPAAKPAPTVNASAFKGFFDANKPKAKTTKPPAKKAATGTSAAQQVVDAALAPLLASITSQEKTLGSNQAAQQAALKAYSQQIIDYLKGAPGAIQADYQGAVDSTRNLAQASADELLKANPNSLNQADLAAINAPQEQRDALAAQNQNVYGGGAATLFHTGGVIPATEFAADKAAAGAFANSLPSIQGLQAQQLFAQLLANQGKDTAELAAQRAEVMSKAPGLLLDAQKELAAGTAGPSSSKAPTTRKIGQAYYQWDPGKGWVKLADAKSSDRTGQVKLANGQYVTTVNGHPVGSAWGPVKTVPAGKGKSTKLYGNSTAGYFTYEGGKLTPVPGFAPKTKNGKKAPSPSQISTTVARAGRVGESALEKYTDRLWENAKAAVGAKGTEEQAQKVYNDFLSKNFGTAMYRVITAIGPHLKTIGYSSAQVKSAAYQIVSAKLTPPKGYKAPPNPKNASLTANTAVGGAVGTAIQVAESELGKPYVFGSGPDTSSFDCSDLIQYAYKQAGISLPRTTYGQIKSGFAVNWRSADDLRPGDLIFPHKGHVVMYIGNGRVIAAPHTGTVVQYQPVSYHLRKGAVVRRIVENGLV